MEVVLIEKASKTLKKSSLVRHNAKHNEGNIVILEEVPKKQSEQTIIDGTTQETDTHLEESGSQKKFLYGCDTCNSYLDSSNALNQHRKDVHSLGKPCSKDSTILLSARQPKCNICQSFYMTKADLVNHLKTVHDLNTKSSESKDQGGHKCNICKEMFAHKERLTKHLEDTHCIYLKRKEGQFECGTCKLGFPSKVVLDDHLRGTHCVNMDVIIVEKDGKRMFQCSLCNISYATKQGLYRHHRHAHNVGGPSKGVCHYCGNTFRLDNLSAHEKACVVRSKPRRRQDCAYIDCNMSFYKKEHLIEHMKSTHSVRIEPMRTLRFKNEEEFISWKEEEEDRTYSYFSKHAGTKNNKRSYYCQHEGTANSHRSSNDTREKRKQNKKGRIKKGCVCTAYLRAITTDTEVIVSYWPTHNHPLSPDDVKHQPLSKETIKFIKEQIVLNVPNRQIQAMVKKRLSENSSCKRDAQVVSLKRITSLAQRYHRQAAEAGSIPNAIVETFNSFMDVLVAQDDSPVLFYQPPIEDANLEIPNNEDHLFFLGLQTTDQQKMLQRGISMPMFISYTKADFTFQYYLISILVPCEKNFEYPVGHLITSQLNEEVVSLFLQTIGERCPELNVNCIVSIDCPEINSAIRKVFGNDGPYFLSKWHFLEFMRNDFLRLVPSNKVEELFDFILAMADAETEDRFLLLYNTFKEQFESEFPDIVSNFAEYFVRASMWASCYRQGPGIIDSCLYADSFFNKLNKKYRRRPIKSINVVPDLLLFIQEEYKDKRETTLDDISSEVEAMEEQHNLASEIPPDLVQETLSHHWSVQGSKHGQVFSVMQCVSKCVERNCRLKCNDCVNLCSHRYFCNCGKSDSICQHVHRVHQQYGYLFEMEGDYSEVEAELDQDEDMENDNNTLAENEDQAMPVTDADTLRADIVSYVENIRTAIENMPLDMLHVCHDTLHSVCKLIDSNSANV